ncbi:MAG: TonB family protein [Paludibacter sp.]|nr:TonB family protein [Paludibacter sp.]
MSKIDLTSFEWRELVFQGKNKEYGAYTLRGESDKRHNRAMLIITIVTIIGFSIPKLIDFIKSRQADKEVYTTTAMATLKPTAEVKEKDIKRVESAEPPPPVKNSVKFTAPEIKDDKDVSEENELQSQEAINNAKGIISIATVVGGDDENGQDIADLKQVVTQVVEEPVLDVVEQMPQYPGGESELMAYVFKNIKYPVIAQENGIQGTVVVKFVVTKSGAVGEVQVLRQLDPACDREAVRVVKTLPNFIPGKQNGVNVNVWFTLPIKYKLE